VEEATILLVWKRSLSNGTACGGLHSLLWLACESNVTRRLQYFLFFFRQVGAYVKIELCAIDSIVLRMQISKYIGSIFNFQCHCLVAYSHVIMLCALYMDCYDHSYSTRSSRALHLLSPQTAVGKKFIKFKTSHLWNQLPDQLKQIRSPNSFKLQLKNYLLNKICWQK